jgi:hypothetical protein
MCGSHPIHTDVVLVAELQELPAGELGPIVGDDGIRHPEPMDDVSEEQHGLLCPEVCDWHTSTHLENLSMATSR